MGTWWEHIANTLGTRGKKLPPPPPPGAHQECIQSILIGCIKLLFSKLFVTIFCVGLNGRAQNVGEVSYSTPLFIRWGASQVFSFSFSFFLGGGGGGATKQFYWPIAPKKKKTWWLTTRTSLAIVTTRLHVFKRYNNAHVLSIFKWKLEDIVVLYILHYTK